MPAARAETLLCQDSSVKLWSCAPAGSPLPACILQLQISSPWRSQAHGPSWKGLLQSLLITAAGLCGTMTICMAHASALHVRQQAFS